MSSKAATCIAIDFIGLPGHVLGAAVDFDALVGTGFTGSGRISRIEFQIVGRVQVQQSVGVHVPESGSGIPAQPSTRASLPTSVKRPSPPRSVQQVGPPVGDVQIWRATSTNRTWIASRACSSRGCSSPLSLPAQAARMRMRAALDRASGASASLIQEQADSSCLELSVVAPPL